MRIVDNEKLFLGKLNPQRVLETKIYKNLENSPFFSLIWSHIFQMSYSQAPKTDPVSTINIEG